MNIVYQASRPNKLMFGKIKVSNFYSSSFDEVGNRIFMSVPFFSRFSSSISSESLRRIKLSSSDNFLNVININDSPTKIIERPYDNIESPIIK